ncbi:MAG TPA: CBS domain-containing protein [Chloroflexota bacterium]|nr:CBS domain-containing protein [Chloroflexota bacterium]
MLLLSQLLGRPVRDAGGEVIASLTDLVGRWQPERQLAVSGLVAKVGHRPFFLPWQQVVELDRAGVRLSSYQVDFRQFERRRGELLLAADLLDRRLIDVRRRRVVRVNDLLLDAREGGLLVSGVDVGFRALVRRLVPRWLSSAFAGIVVVDWADVEWLPSEGGAEAKLTFPLLARLHPVEVAHIVDELPARQAADIVESLEDEDAAEVLSEVSEDHQAGVLRNLDEERAADILEEMEPDDAADLLAKLDPSDAGDLLHRMEDEEARDVQALMEYKEGTAGGLMTSHFVVVPRQWTAAEALGLLRRMEDRPETVTHLLVVDRAGSEQLVGMVALLDVVVAEPEAVIDSLMTGDVPRVEPDTDTSEVARRMAEYNLAVIPVVDEEGRVLGIVAVDDVVEEMLPERWRRRLPRLFG